MNDEELTLNATMQVHIKRGHLDNSLDDLVEAIINRRKRIARDMFNKLQPGDKVRVTQSKPKYMIGLEGVVVEKRQSKVEVDFGRPIGRFGRRIICPVSILEVIR